MNNIHNTYSATDHFIFGICSTLLFLTNFTFNLLIIYLERLDLFYGWMDGWMELELMLKSVY